MSFRAEDLQLIACEQAAAALIKVKPTFVAIGDVNTLPYSDELGL